MAAPLGPPPPGDGHSDVFGTLDSIPACIWVAGADGRSLYYNQPFRHYLGRPLAELLDRGWQAVVHPDDLAEVVRRAAVAIRTGDRYEIEHRVRRADGAFRWHRVEAVPVRNPGGKILRWVGTSSDVEDRRRAEAAVARDSVILAGVRDSVIVTDLNGVVTYWNDGAARLFGWPAEEMVGRPLTDRYPESARAEVAANVARLAAGAEWDGEFEDYRRDGSRVWIHARARHLRGPDGSPIGIVGVAHDITDGKAAEAALRASEARFRAVVEGGFDAVYLVTADGRILYASPGAEALLGFAPDERTGTSFDALVHPDDAPGVRVKFAQILADPETWYTSTHRTRHKSGAYRHLEARGRNLLADPAVGAIVIHARDVTAAWEARAAAESGLARLTAVINSMSEGLLTADGAGNVLDCNPAALQLYGFTSVAEVRRPVTYFTSIFELVTPGGTALPLTEWPLVRLLRGESVVDSELRMRRLDVGKEWDILFNGRAMPGPDGRPELVVMTLRDVTAQKRLEESYRQAEKMQAVGRLAGGFAHEMNNLLTVINGYSEVLLGVVPPGEARTLAEEVNRAGERAAGLTSQLLAFSRKQVVTYRVLDVSALLDSLGGLLRPLLGELVRLEVSAAGGVWPVRADPGQLEQVVVNLAVNARDAMPNGGTLTVSARNVMGETVPGVPAGPYVEVAVADTGKGMPPEVVALIFEPFFTTKGVGEGTGLGLAVVHGIVQGHNGHIRVETQVGKGSTFRVLLPAVPSARLSEAMAKPGSAPPRGTEKVLLVEDDAEVRKLTRRTLESLGYTVREAANGEQGLAEADRDGKPIDLLVTDVVMPRMGGRQLAERLMARHPRLKVLYLSGYTDDAVVRHGVESARMPFLSKPYTLDDLARKVRAVLDGPG
jgi:two-component system, cell cycle sensor histidine kinase and response regulator CckA